MDNLANSQSEVLSRVRTLAAKFHLERNLKEEFHPPLYFHDCDIQDKNRLSEVVGLYGKSGGRSKIVATIHFAALKSVSGSFISWNSHRLS